MGFLTRRVSWANWEFGPLKLAMLTMGIVVGAAFSEFWRPYLLGVGLVSLVMNLWVGVIWVLAMRRAR